MNLPSYFKRWSWAWPGALILLITACMVAYGPPFTTPLPELRRQRMERSIVKPRFTNQLFIPHFETKELTNDVQLVTDHIGDLRRSLDTQREITDGYKALLQQTREERDLWRKLALDLASKIPGGTNAPKVWGGPLRTTQ